LTVDDAIVLVSLWLAVNNAKGNRENWSILSSVDFLLEKPISFLVSEKKNFRENATEMLE